MNNIIKIIQVKDSHRKVASINRHYTLKNRPYVKRSQNKCVRNLRSSSSSVTRTCPLGLPICKSVDRRTCYETLSEIDFMPMSLHLRQMSNLRWCVLLRNLRISSGQIKHTQKAKACISAHSKLLNE